MVERNFARPLAVARYYGNLISASLGDTVRSGRVDNAGVPGGGQRNGASEFFTDHFPEGFIIWLVGSLLEGTPRFIRG